MITRKMMVIKVIIPDRTVRIQMPSCLRDKEGIPILNSTRENYLLDFYLNYVKDIKAIRSKIECHGRLFMATF